MSARRGRGMGKLIALLVAVLALHPGTSAASCTEAELSRAASISPQAWVQKCRQCGGRVTTGGNNRCVGFQQSSSAPGAGAPNLSGISSAIADAMKQREAEIERQNRDAMRNLDANNRSRLADEQQQVQQFQDEKTTQEERRRQEALTRMGPSDAGIPRMDFDDYRRREAERRGARTAPQGRKLSKQEQDWCKLNIPLKPTGSIRKVEGQDEERMAIYEMKKAEWDRRCASPAVEGAKAR